MGIYAYIIVSSDEEKTKLQRDEISEYKQAKEIVIDKIYEFNLKARQSKTNISLDKIIENLNTNDSLIIEKLNILGDTIFKVIQKITRLMNKNVNLYLIYEGIILRPNDERFNLLYNLLSLENKAIKKRIQTAHNTCKTKSIKLGRKTGKKTNSIYDKYKKKIMSLDKLGLSKKKIIDEIKVGSAQGLGVYIKKIKANVKKDTSSKTYIQNRSSNKKNGFGINVPVMNSGGTMSNPPKEKEQSIVAPQKLQEEPLVENNSVGVDVESKTPHSKYKNNRKGGSKKKKR
ncbi:MAG: recombinase family protein [Arcobacteraceae bacterium]|jgi:DNA invertase Pin-like site-specific DNA recombinase|nr:recombinase family protein [Arcobacteraceae bacterium]